MLTLEHPRGALLALRVPSQVEALRVEHLEHRGDEITMAAQHERSPWILFQDAPERIRHSQLPVSVPGRLMRASESGEL